MKLSTFAIAITLSIASTSTLAKNVVLTPIDEKIETQACLVAATQGLKAAKTFLFDNQVNYNKVSREISCNGYKLSNFAKRYYKEDKLESKETRVALVLKNTKVESKVCLEALVVGEKTAREKYSLEDTVILCNNQHLGDFVRKFDDQVVEIRDYAEE